VAKAKQWLAALLTIILTLTSVPVFAEQGIPLQAQPGEFAVISGEYIFLALGNNRGGKSLFRVPISGGAYEEIDSASQIDDLVSINSRLYYLRVVDQRFQVAVRDSGGTITVLKQFDQGQLASRLLGYNDNLYCLVNGELTLIRPIDGSTERVSSRLMREFTIVGGLVYYASGEAVDELSYNNGTYVSGTVGKLYAMWIDGTNDTLVFEQGVDKIQAQGDYLFFHNLQDNYATTDNTSTWLEGYLYRLNVNTNQLTQVSGEADWDYRLVNSNLILYTENSLALGALSGSDMKTIYQPALMTSIAPAGDSLLVYEYENSLLTRVWLNGASPQLLASHDSYTPENQFLTVDDEHGDENDPGDDPALNADPTPNPDATAKPKSTATPKPKKDNTYIFPKSNKELLTRRDIEKVDGKLWAYGRNEIYARHGYKFKTKIYRDYFNKKAWYKEGGFSTKKLSEIEWANMALLKEMEEERKSSMPTTDNSYIFSRSNKDKLTEEQIRKMDPSLWPYARNEILARHGYKFNTAKYRDYFNSKSWYKEGGYNSKKVSSVEWYNIDLLKKLEKSG